MSFPYVVKVRPVCVHCGKRCGARWRTWEQLKPQPWDGQTWLWKYNPFCTLRCAFSYARKCYEKG